MGYLPGMSIIEEKTYRFEDIKKCHEHFCCNDAFSKRFFWFCLLGGLRFINIDPQRNNFPMMLNFFKLGSRELIALAVYERTSVDRKATKSMS